MTDKILVRWRHDIKKIHFSRGSDRWNVESRSDGLYCMAAGNLDQVPMIFCDCVTEILFFGLTFVVTGISENEKEMT